MSIQHSTSSIQRLRLKENEDFTPETGRESESLNAECRILNALSVTRLSLTAFRNYTDTRLELDTAPVVLTGPNGSGKTNLLEAISLLLPGRGLRRAPLVDMQNRTQAAPWAVAAELFIADQTLRLGTGRDPETPDDARRVVHIDGKAVKSQQALADHVSMAWITPDMDRLLADGPSARRKLLDRLVFSFDPAHAGRVHRYEKALRERLRMLRDNINDPPWYDALEDSMAQTGVAIAAARLHLLRQLQVAMEETTTVFPLADIALKGLAEESLGKEPALLVEEKLRAALTVSRPDDAQTGTCAIGPHRSDLIVIHSKHQCPANLCSTGEQKALMITIMLAYVRVLMQAKQKAPIFLLDDITAHLDDQRRHALFEEIRTLDVQAWLTGTDADHFRAFGPSAQYFTIDQGNIAKF
jgi:DNA replication and repair protein RecF